MKAWIKEEHPKKALLTKVLSGDTGDGVPNFLSDDDTFVVQGKRQKRLTQKKIDLILACFKPESIMNNAELAGYMRNKYLIDFDYIPDNLQENILTEYDKPVVPTATTVYKYLMSQGLSNLVNKIGDF
jgi:hypothetical protein